ncbi:MAG TPA: hypothetical protein VMI75_38240 [Polyangiaceae bacterium]|nr:hypothetical protein [Polyangiaceae bacterium]
MKAFVVLFGVLMSGMVAACSTAASPTGGADGGYCGSNGYIAPTGGACPKGTCMAQGTSQPCCGSICPSCESKGLVSYDEAGQCPPGLCPSGDQTVSLSCCDTCGPIGAESAPEAGPDSSPDAPSTASDASGQ